LTELAWLHTEVIYLPEDGNSDPPSTNRAQRRVTSFIRRYRYAKPANVHIDSTTDRLHFSSVQTRWDGMGWDQTVSAMWTHLKSWHSWNHRNATAAPHMYSVAAEKMHLQ